MANNNENYLKVIGDKKQLKEFKKRLKPRNRLSPWRSWSPHRKRT